MWILFLAILVTFGGGFLGGYIIGYQDGTNEPNRIRRVELLERVAGAARVLNLPEAYEHCARKLWRAHCAESWNPPEDFAP